MVVRDIFALGVVASVVAFASTAEAACSASNWNFIFGQETTTSRETDGAPCAFRVTNVGGNGAVYGVNIAVPPRHGSASTSGRAGVIYRPQAGFKGEDIFVFELVGKLNGAPISAKVRATVTVK